MEMMSFAPGDLLFCSVVFHLVSPFWFWPFPYLLYYIIDNSVIFYGGNYSCVVDV